MAKRDVAKGPLPFLNRVIMLSMKEQQITIRLDEKEQALLSRLSQQEQKSESEIIRTALREYCQKALAKKIKELQNHRNLKMDTSEIPEQNETSLQKERKGKPLAQETVTIALDKDILQWLKHQTPHYQILINQVLRAYMDKH